MTVRTGVIGAELDYWKIKKLLGYKVSEGVYRDLPSTNKGLYYLCECLLCHREFAVKKANLVQGSTKSCRSCSSKLREKVHGNVQRAQAAHKQSVLKRGVIGELFGDWKAVKFLGGKDENGQYTNAPEQEVLMNDRFYECLNVKTGEVRVFKKNSLKSLRSKYKKTD